jgi:hypothetical protein
VPHAVESGCYDPALRDTACAAGCDPEFVDALLDGVRLYCRNRHGTENVAGTYLRFLIERSAARTRGAAEDRAHYADAPGGTPEAALLGALRAADDPASLYEAHCHGLVTMARSDCAPGGCVVRVRLAGVQVSEAEDLELVWHPVFRRMAAWIADWRTGTSALSTVAIRPPVLPRTAQPRWRAAGETAIRAAEARRGLEPAGLLWE